MALLVITYATDTGKFYSQLIGTAQLAPGAALSGNIGSGQIDSDHIRPAAIIDTKIASGITANKLHSGYFGFKVASGYPAVGLTGLIERARISGLPSTGWPEQSFANLLLNGDFEVGDPPTGWSNTLAATISRSSVQVKIGSYSIKIELAIDSHSAYQNISNYLRYASRKVTLGCWVWCASGNVAQLRISDGVGGTNSAYHTGSSAWEWITVIHTVNASPNILTALLTGNIGTAYFDGAILVEGDVCPAFSPKPLDYQSVISGYIAPSAVGDGHIADMAATKLTGQIPQARISGLFVSGLQLSGAIQPDNISFLAGMISRPTPPGAVLDLDFAEGTGVGANEVDKIKTLTNVYDKSGLNNDGTLLPTPTEINVCDLISGWLATSGYTALSVDTGVKVEGAGAIKTIASGLVSGSIYFTRYNPDAVINLSARKHLAFWARVNQPSTYFENARAYITDTSGYYRYWDIPFTSGLWKKQKCLLSVPDGQLSGIALASIDHIEPLRVQNKVVNGSFDSYIDYLIADDRPVFEDGIFGPALSFDGVDDYVNAGSAAVLDDLTEFTYEAWIYQKGEGYYYIVGKAYKALLSPENRVLYAAVSCSDGYAYAWTDNNAIPLNEWTHIAMTFKYTGASTRPKLYMNGIDAATGGTSRSGTLSSDAAKNLCIGCHSYDISNFFLGLIDEVRIYNRALPAEEIRGRYIQGLAKLGKLQGSLRLFTSGWVPTIHLDPDSANFRAISGAIRTSGLIYAGTTQVQLTNALGYLISGAIGSGQIATPHIRPLGILDASIASGITAAKILSGYTGLDGTSGYVLTARGAGILPAYAITTLSLVKVQTHTRVGSAASGNVSYTGYGFKPKALVIFASWGNAVSWGASEGTNNKCIFLSQVDPGNYYDYSTSYCIDCSYTDGYQTALVQSFDVDGFTLAWEGSGSHAGSVTFVVLAIG